MKNSDLQQIALIVETKLDDKLAPILKLVNEHEQILYGKNNDGLVSDVKDIKKKVFLAVSGIATAFSAVVNITLHFQTRKY